MSTNFIKDRERTAYFYATFIELLLSIVSFYAAAYLREQYNLGKDFVFTREYQLLLVAMAFIWFFILRSKNFEKFNRTQTYSAILIDYTKGIIIGIACLAGAIFIFKLETISRGFILIFIPLNLLVLYLFRVCFYKALKQIRTRGKNQKYVMVIGDESSENLIDQIIKNKEWGLKIVKIISNSALIYNKYRSLCPVVPQSDELHHIVELDIIDEIIYYKNNINQKELNRIIYSCEEVGVVFHLYSECWNLTGRKYHLSYFGGNPYFTYMNTPSDYLALHVKNLMDYTISFLLLIFLLPVMSVIATAIKLDSKGPVFFKQERVGLRGRKFKLYKFRTMVAEAEAMRVQMAGLNEMDGPVFKIKNDPRITRVGSFLRRAGLDELPQLINIMKGQMSFIGPRPPIRKEVEQYERWQLRRLSMKPGLSCIWQTMPKRNEIVFNDWMQMDLQYIDSWSLRLDLILFIRSLKTIFMRSGQ